MTLTMLVWSSSASPAAPPGAATRDVVRWSEDAAGRVRETLRGGTVDRVVFPWAVAPELSLDRQRGIVEAVYAMSGPYPLGPRLDENGASRPPEVHVVGVYDAGCAARFVLALTCMLRGMRSIVVASVQEDGELVRILGRAVLGVASERMGWVESIDLRLLHLRQGRFLRLRSVSCNRSSGSMVSFSSYTLIQLSDAGGLTIAWSGVPSFETDGSHYADVGYPAGRGFVVLSDVNGDGFEDVLLTREDREVPAPDLPATGRPAFDDPAMKRVGSVDLQARWWRGRFHERPVRAANESYPYADWCEVLE